MVADGALAGRIVGKSKIVEDTRPAVDVTTESELRRVGREETNRAGCRLAASLLQHHLLHDVPVDDGVGVDGVVDQISAVAQHKLAGGLQVVLGRVPGKVAVDETFSDHERGGWSPWFCRSVDLSGHRPTPP